MNLPPINFLLDSSVQALEDLELASLNRSANLAKALRAELDAWVEQRAVAMLARWMLENRVTLLSVPLKPQKVEFVEDAKKRA